MGVNPVSPDFYFTARLSRQSMVVFLRFRTMKKNISHDLLKRYLQGKTTREESARVDEWYESIGNAPDDLMMDAATWEEMERNILSRIKGSDDFTSAKERNLPLSFWQKSLRVAAAITIITVVGVSVLLFGMNESGNSGLHTFTGSSKIQRIANNTKATTEQLLSDGTVIQLAPNSSIEFPTTFASNSREVYLKGEAFFDVAKDKKRPFSITTSDVTIKVLGTSFTVKAYEDQQVTNVAVKTGIVSVSTKVKMPGKGEKKNQEVILTPNQEFTYNAANENFSRKLVDQPQVILEEPKLFKMQYDNMPVVKIFNAMEENYGIDIFYDEADLSNCVLTTSMDEEGLFERIEIITKAIGAQYEITDSRIIIKSNGCP